MTNKALSAGSGFLGMLIGLGAIGLLSGCLAIYPPVFAQQPPDSAPFEEQSVRLIADERGPLLSLGAILFGVGLWRGLRVYQQWSWSKNSVHAQNLRRQVLARIAGLDERYAQGRLRERAYRRKRQHLKQQALEITLRQYSEQSFIIKDDAA